MNTYMIELPEGAVHYCVVKARENNCSDNVIIAKVLVRKPPYHELTTAVSDEWQSFMEGVIAVASDVSNVASALADNGYSLIIDPDDLMVDTEAVILTTVSAYNLLMAAEFGAETLSQLMCMGADLPENYSNNLDYWLQAIDEFRNYLTTTV